MNEIPVHGKAAKSTSHIFEVQYWIYKEPHRDYIEVEIIGEDALASVLAEYVEDYVHEVFEDVVFDALRQGTASMNELGVYNIYTVATDVYKAAEAYIEEKSSEMSLVIVDDYSNTQSPKTISFNVIPILKTMLADRQTCECWSVDVGGAISGDIMDFQDNGVWQFGLSSAETIYCNPEEWPTPKRLNGVVVWEAENEELTPTLWFSRKGQSPMQRWTITPQITKEALRLWFLAADEDIMESIVDEFNEIGIWYLYECGMDVPDMSVLVGRCPVQFDESDDSETIGEKITSFFLNQQHQL